MEFQEQKAIGAVLDRSQKFLAGYLHLEDILPILSVKGALTKDDVQRIKQISDQGYQVHQLITILKRKSKVKKGYYYHVFIDVLRDQQKELYKLVKDIEADFTELKANSSKFSVNLN